MNKWTMVAIVGCIAGCTGGQPNGTPSLGITGYEITETANELKLLGVDAQHNLVAMVDVTAGPYTDPNDGTQVPKGRTLLVAVGEKSATSHAASTRTTHVVMPSPVIEELDVVLLEPEVATALERWGIATKAAQTATLPAGQQVSERPYNFGGCSFDYTNNCGGSATCCENDWYGAPSYEKVEFVCCASASAALLRYCPGNGSCWYGDGGADGDYPNCTYGAYCNPNSHNCQTGPSKFQCCLDDGGNGGISDNSLPVGNGGCEVVWTYAQTYSTCTQNQDPGTGECYEPTTT